MTNIIEFVRREPVRVFNVAVLFLTLAVSYGLDMSGEQQAIIVGILAAVLGVGGEAVRARVTPTRKLPPTDT